MLVREDCHNLLSTVSLNNRVGREEQNKEKPCFSFGKEGFPTGKGVDFERVKTGRPFSSQETVGMVKIKRRKKKEKKKTDEVK